MTYVNKKRKLRSFSHLEEEEAIMKDEEAMLEEAGEADGGAGDIAPAARRHSPRRTRGKSDAPARSAASASAETPSISNASKRRKGKKAASAASSSSSGATAAAKNIAPTLEEGDEDGSMDADDTPPTKIPPSKRLRTRSRGLSMASAATTGNESAGPTIAGPVVEVVDPASLLGGGMDGFDGASGRDRLLSFADTNLLGGRDRLFSFGIGADAGSIGAAGSPEDHFPSAPVAGGASGGGTSGRSRKLSVDFSLTGSHPPPSDHSGHHPHGDPVDSLVGTAVDALLGSRPRSMSQESSIGSLGLRSRSNTLDLMAGSGILEGGSSDLLGLGGSGGRSRSNTLEFLSGVALGEGLGAPDGPDGHVHFDTNLSGKLRSGSHGSYSSHQSGNSKEITSSSHARQKTSRGSQRNKRRGDTISSAALDHLDALGETKPAAVSHAAAVTAASGGTGPGASKRHGGSGATASSATNGKNRKNSDHSQDSAHTLDSAHQKLLYEALISGGGASGIGSGGRQRSDTTESWTALIATSARERADSWGGMSDISFGAAAGHADIVAEITANALHHDVIASSGHIDANDTAGGLALVQMATPPTSAQASLTSGSTGPGAAARGKKSSTSKTSSVPKKIAVKTKKSATARPATGASGTKIRRADAASSAPVTHSLSVNFPKNMPHGAAAAAAKAAAEAATAAGASPAELSAIVAAAMATVSKQLFNIASDVEKAIASTKAGGKTPPGMKKVKIEYTARPVAMAKPSNAAKSRKPGAKPSSAAKSGIKPVVRPQAAARSAPTIAGAAATAPKLPKKAIGTSAISSATTTVSTKMPAAPSEKPQKAVARHPGAPISSIAASSGSTLPASTSISLPGPKVASQVATGASLSAITKTEKPPTEKKRLPPRKRTDSGFGFFDTAMTDLPAPLPDVSPVKEDPAPAVAPPPPAAPTAATAAAAAAPAAPSTTNSQISVDYDAVAAAVDAASSATLPGDLTKVAAAGATLVPPPAALNPKVGPSGVPSTIIPSGTMKSPPPSTVASRVSQPTPKTPAPQPPLKKRTKRPTPPDQTPLIHNRTSIVVGRPPMPSASTSTASAAIASAIGNGTIRQNMTAPGPAPRRLVPSTPATGASTSTAGSYSSIATPGSAMSYSTSNTQSNQKWDEMFECLVEYVREQNTKHSGTMRGGKPWKWDGNVPTTYKTKDGKALGRWINNQRSAKTKGSLKPEREERLLSTGLKWSVLSTNAWPDMLRELRKYVKEKEASGESWDGNVPTNYRIKAKGSDFDEDKNLGRWINRQRSLYQAGKLKKERQEELERMGLRWSVLSTTSWDVMYEALLEYAEDRRTENPESGWDGNVPANFKTEDNPPKSLGRWVNRQRSAYAKNKLKQEFVTRLEQAGLKWSVHERRDYS